MKIKNMMIATIGTVLLLSVGCTSKSVQTTERVPAQQGLGTGNIGSSNVYDDNERLNTLFVVEAVRSGAEVDVDYARGLIDQPPTRDGQGGGPDRLFGNLEARRSKSGAQIPRSEDRVVRENQVWFALVTPLLEQL